MTLEERYRLGIDKTWVGRCLAGAIQAATNVMSEEASTPGHAERAAFANKVLIMPDAHASAIGQGVAAQPGIAGYDATDQDILFTINSLWDAWSGVAA